MPTELVKLELGGGANSRPGFWNVDRAPGITVHHACDLEALYPSGSEHLPLADESVSDVYSAHCLEHVYPLHGVLREVARVCVPGAHFVLVVPHWLSPMAMCHGHRHVIAPEQVEHWCSTHVAHWWGDSPRRL